MSWWHIDNLSEINLIAAVIISNFKNKENNLRFVCIDDKAFLNEGFIYENSPENGITAFKKMKNNHYDVKCLNYSKLGKIAKLICFESLQGNIINVKW